MFNSQQSSSSQEQLLSQARALAQTLRAQYGAISALELARTYGIEVAFDSWQVAAGRLLYLAECTRQPARIVVNERALALLSQSEQVQRTQLCELVIAHELGHLLSPRSAVWASFSRNEAVAHAFAEAWTGCAVAIRSPR